MLRKHLGTPHFVAGLCLAASVAWLACGEANSPRAADPAGDPATNALPAAAAASTGASARRAGCAERNPLRQAFFGDLHVHTGISRDASSWGARSRPDDAYRFASGGEEPLVLRGPIARGRAERERSIRIARPLDFAAVTDHADYIAGSTRLTPDAELRREVWQENIEATEQWYDRSAKCAFTTFHAYEYTAKPDRSVLHRNVIFKNDAIPELPVSVHDAPTPEDLWRELRAQCIERGDGCDALAIPHNANLSNGRMFAPPGDDAVARRSWAEQRNALEPLVEIMQSKGDSECRPGFEPFGQPDELCAFEKWRDAPVRNCGLGSGTKGSEGCVSFRDFVRNVLVVGLVEQAAIGVNPFRFGILAATDTHNGNAGDVDERRFSGIRGKQDASPRDRLERGFTRGVANAATSPGGLAGVWAEENSREAIFEALRRREVFGTSGPRMSARFFAGWDLDPGLCKRGDFAARGYADGVPMGSVLMPLETGPAAAAASHSAPRFAISALRDPGSAARPGGRLQRIQIVKGWLDTAGKPRQAIYDVAGDATRGEVDPASCETDGAGYESLCAVWRDDDYDPAQPAVYYARVLETPSCRWSGHQCAAWPQDEPRPAACSDGARALTQQERLWTSPIWIEPRGAGS